MGFYEIPVDIQAGSWNTEKIPKKLREYHRYFLKTHGITNITWLLHNTFEVLNTDILGMKYRLVF